MIHVNGKLTTWTDNLNNLLIAAHDAVFSNKYKSDEEITLYSEDHDTLVTIVAGTATTESEEFKNIALEQEYWVEKNEWEEWEIFLNWSKEEGNPPSKRAIHA